MSGMNRVFEQDPQFPYFGSREEQSAFYSAKYPAPDDKKIQSGPAPTAGGPVRKPPRTRIIHNLPSYSAQCKKFFAESKTAGKKSQVSTSDSDDDVPIFNFEIPKSDSLADDDVQIFGKKQDDEQNKPPSLSLLTAKPPALAASREIRRKIERIHQGETKVELINPQLDAGLTDLALDVEKLVQACIIWPVTSLELQVSDSRLCRRSIKNDLSREQGTPLGAMDSRGLYTVGLFLQEINRTRRRIDFVGLSNTLLTEDNVFYLLGLLQCLNVPLPSAASQRRPRIEMLQTRLSATLREQLLAAGERAGIDILLSAPSGPFMNAYAHRAHAYAPR